MEIPQCQLPGYIVMFETPLKMAAQLLRHYPSLTQCQTSVSLTQCLARSVSLTQCLSVSVSVTQCLGSVSDSVSVSLTQCLARSVSLTQCLGEATSLDPD